jgi:hypothetical protein
MSKKADLAGLPAFGLPLGQPPRHPVLQCRLERQNGARPEAPRNRRRDGLVLPEGSEGLLRHEAMLRDRQREERQGSAGTRLLFY